MPTDQPTQFNLAAAQPAEQEEQNRLFIGKRGLGLGPAAKLLVDPLQRVSGAQLLPLRCRKGSKSKKLVAGLLEALVDRLAADFA